MTYLPFSQKPRVSGGLGVLGTQGKGFYFGGFKGLRKGIFGVLGVLRPFV